MTILSEEPQFSSLVVARKSKPCDSFLAHSKVPQGHTDELLTWLTKVQQKKQSIRTTRHRDLRKEALLESSRLASQAELEAKRQERLQRWRQVMPSLSPPTSPPHGSQPEGEESLCDCDSCFLCQRHRPQMYGKCYCNVIFSPRPVFMDFSYGSSSAPAPVSATDAFCDDFADDENSLQADDFLASLSLKRKTEDDLVGRKRAKA